MHECEVGRPDVKSPNNIIINPQIILDDGKIMEQIKHNMQPLLELYKENTILLRN